jgi:heme/copper-type cytochrome/quinol oxidase subunit 3
MTAQEPARERLVVDGRALDVARLPSFGFGQRSLMWWGTAGLMAIEGTVFGLAVMSYFYLRSHVAVWPMNEPPPLLAWGSANTLLMLASLWPNQLAKRCAERLELAGARLWMTVCFAMSLGVLWLRWLEFGALNCLWWGDAYASVVWTLMGLHTTHLVTDAWDTGVLVALSFAGPFENKRFVDVSENALYWIFVVLSWLPIYAVVYWVPRSL